MLQYRPRRCRRAPWFFDDDRPAEEREAQLLARELERHEGHVLHEAPDLALWVFGRASDAVAAATRVQTSLLRLPPEARLRMALCSGEVELVRRRLSRRGMRARASPATGRAQRTDSVL
jgi:hypothetical protein